MYVGRTENEQGDQNDILYSLFYIIIYNLQALLFELTTTLASGNVDHYSVLSY